MKYKIRGFKAGSLHCGIKKYKNDLAIIYSEVPAVASAVFTLNKVKAAPVILSQKHIKNGKISAIVVNSGNANACTGKIGLLHANLMAKTSADALNIKRQEVLVASTGVIGVILPINKIINGIKKVCRHLNYGHWQKCAAAIITTDTFPKIILDSFMIDGKKCNILGLAKGSGMINPNLATMLSFILSDVSINKKYLDTAFKEVVSESFNSITVDGDTSTNDTVCILANGFAGNKAINEKDKHYNKFLSSLKYVMTNLAKMIVKDGEGADKFIEIEVLGAKDKNQAKSAGLSIAKSNLFKTAMHGANPNWGRIMSALGNSGVYFRENKVDMYFDKLLMAKDGCEVKFNEKESNRILSKKNIKIIVHLNIGQGKANVWTCDLTEKYIKINAHYRT
ncbi:MAG: bifunctional glutamate N-acetyltransferase/amino-acid acetyltransferase ArgJ [Candidatus Firestonebacteria bacterium]